MPVKVVLDANVFISSFLNPNGFPAKVINAWSEGKFDCIISLPLLTEITNILQLPRIRIKYNLLPDEIEKFLQLIAWHSHKINLSGKFKLCHHSNDDLILETAVMGKAKYLVTRDDDIKRDQNLIIQMSAHGITVLSVRNFLERLKSNKL